MFLWNVFVLCKTTTLQRNNEFLVSVLCVFLLVSRSIPSLTDVHGFSKMNSI